MRFWDSSAIVPLLVKQDSTAGQTKLLRSDTTQIVCWTTHCECFSALARLEREGALTPQFFKLSHQRLLSMAASWQVVLPEEALQQETKRILRTHGVRCADAFQLASAVLASGKRPATLQFVTLDNGLALAASREGFEVIEG